MTELASIPNNHLALQCEACGHGANVAVAVLIKTFANIGVREIAERAHLARCKDRDGPAGRALSATPVVGSTFEQFD